MKFRTLLSFVWISLVLSDPLADNVNRILQKVNLSTKLFTFEGWEKVEASPFHSKTKPNEKSFLFEEGTRCKHSELEKNDLEILRSKYIRQREHSIPHSVPSYIPSQSQAFVVILSFLF